MTEANCLVEMGSEEAPLLLPAPAVEGCPGCVMERRKASSKGRIPYKELFFVGVTSLASSLPITCLFPFIYFMVCTVMLSSQSSTCISLCINLEDGDILYDLNYSIGGYDPTAACSAISGLCTHVLRFIYSRCAEMTKDRNTASNGL